ncbi:hypothetical protein IC611_01885 [Proteus mirabilis]
MTQLSKAQYGYSDMLVGKNCILLNHDAYFCLPSEEPIGKVGLSQKSPCYYSVQLRRNNR